MITLQQVVDQEKQRIIQVNQAKVSNRGVSAITILDSSSSDGQTKAGELIITSSRMLPNSLDATKQFVSQLVRKQTTALMIKPYSDGETSEVSKDLIEYCDQLNYPLFRIQNHTTIVQVLNDVNDLLSEGRRINKMADLDLDYLLKSNSPSDKDFDFISGLKHIDLSRLNVRVSKITFAQAPSARKRLSVQFSLIGQIQDFFDRVLRENRIKTYFILESSNGATAISFFDHDQVELPPYDREPYKRLINNVRIPNYTVYEGVSNPHVAKKIHRANTEASFSTEIAKTLNWSMRPIFYRDVSLWDLVRKLSKIQDSRLYPVEMDQALEDHEMFETIREFFRQNESLKKTSQALFTHPNTIRYRLNMIYRQTGLDYRLTNDKFLIYIAFIKKLMADNQS